MRIYCIDCGINCSSELPAGSVIRAIVICPDCYEADYDDLMVECIIDDRLMGAD